MNSAFAYIEPGGSKDSEGKTVPRSLRHFPIHDAAHVRNALARAPQSPFANKAMAKITAAAKKFKIGDYADSSRAEQEDEEPAVPFVRSFVLEDISIRAGGDGRTVDAYAAVFDQPAPVRDQDGDYDEVIDPACFNRAIEHAHRSGRKIPVLFNHGMTLFHTPDPEGGLPIGVAEEIRPDGRGLFTRARFHKTPRADQVLEGIREGSISAYSFSGAFKRSDPAKRGRYRGETVRRLESTLREFGPATFPVYQGAEIVGVRSELLGELERLVEYFRSGVPLGTPAVTAEPAAGDPPPEGHSVRPFRAQLLAARARMIIKGA